MSKRERIVELERRVEEMGEELSALRGQVEEVRRGFWVSPLGVLVGVPYQPPAPNWYVVTTTVATNPCGEKCYAYNAGQGA